MNAKRILVADDEVHMIRVVKLFLERAGYKVDTAPNGQEALDSVLLDPPDALLIDINMPRMTGQQLCMELQRRLPERKFPIFVMTGTTEHENREWMQQIPDTELLEKPLSMHELVANLARRFAPDPTAAERNIG